MSYVQDLSQRIAEIVEGEFNTSVEIVLTRPDPEFGDFSINVALQLSKQVGKNPREIAQIIADKITETLADVIDQVTIAGPGFINLKLTNKVLLNLLKESDKIPQILKNQEVVAEYSDPNPFKDLHAGHLYTSITGDSLARLFQASGANVHRINYGGDVGLHVGKAMWGIIQNLGGENPEKLSEVLVDERTKWLSQRYVEGTAAYEDNEQSKNEIVEINKRVYQLQASNDHDSDFAKIYWECREWSYQGFRKLYDKLKMVPFERYLPESEVTSTGLDIVNQGLKNGVFEDSDGAVVFRGEEHGLHTRVFINSAGLPTYEAKDLGLAATKWKDYHFDANFIITGNDIVEYMKVVLKALTNFYPEVAERTTHLTHGMVKLPGGVKMSSRKGNVLKAFDILDAAEQAASKLSEQTVDYEIVLAAVKYAFLKSRMGGDIVYDPEESVALDGNSGPYLQYAYARACSILRKSNLEFTDANDLDDQERLLTLKITEFNEVVVKATKEYSPHLICTYLYELAQVFNRFYEKNRVVGDSREANRLYLIGCYAKVLKSGLDLLGIFAPEKM